ncbi:MAG: nucleotidyltransferase family protein [Actinomycetia bacterium]|nr:nucleotidyltransferase family protein [Actinomycetes bacterium]
MPVAAVVLAAGSGSRFSGSTHKLRAEVDGRPLICTAVDAALESGIGPVIVVTGAEPLGDLLAPSVIEVHAGDWSAGQSHSLAAAVGAVEATSVQAIVVGLGDMPGVTAECWRAVAGSGAQIGVATYGGHRRPPVRIARELWPELPAAGDEGARALMRRRPDLVVEVPVDGDSRDVDTVDDLRSEAGPTGDQ